MQDFKDFPGVALVVGGSGGIGSEICRLFAEKGSNVAFTYKSNVEKAEVIAGEISSYYCTMFFPPLSPFCRKRVICKLKMSKRKVFIHYFVTSYISFHWIHALDDSS